MNGKYFLNLHRRNYEREKWFVKKEKLHYFQYVVLERRGIKEVKFAFIIWYIEILRFYKS